MVDVVNDIDLLIDWIGKVDRIFLAVLRLFGKVVDVLFSVGYIKLEHLEIIPFFCNWSMQCHRNSCNSIGISDCTPLVKNRLFWNIRIPPFANLLCPYVPPEGSFSMRST